jgi:1-deoxy-D-xylulose-5-phosphate reductoisomerase
MRLTTAESGVYIHRKSIVHSMIQMSDGSYHLGGSSPDMIYPVAHALMYPECTSVIHDVNTDPPAWPALEFTEVSPERYPGFKLALDAGRTGGTATALFNGANEEAVGMFLKGNIGFTDIPLLIDMVMNSASAEYGESLEIFTEADARARALVRERAAKILN